MIPNSTIVYNNFMRKSLFSWMKLSHLNINKTLDMHILGTQCIFILFTFITLTCKYYNCIKIQNANYNLIDCAICLYVLKKADLLKILAFLMHVSFFTILSRYFMPTNIYFSILSQSDRSRDT